VACGPGLYAAELEARGARVTGHHISPRKVELARYRVQSADFRVQDLASLLEPRPTPAAAGVDSARYERLMREPCGFLAIRAILDPRR
jgi:hypothetical protein